MIKYIMKNLDYCLSSLFYDIIKLTWNKYVCNDIRMRKINITFSAGIKGFHQLNLLQGVSEYFICNVEKHKKLYT